jgi:hypothetical protein
VGGGTNCVQVDVFRDGTNGSAALPTWFAPLFGVNSQGIRATATAWATTGNMTNCVRPFSVTDKWIEQVPVGPPRPPALTDDYDHWVKVGNSAVALNPADLYTPPSGSSAGTGFQLPADYGTRVVLKTGNNPQSPTGGISPGWSLPVRLPDGAGGYFSGASDYRSAIEGCTAGPVTIGQYLPAENGVMNGPTNQGVNGLIALDKGASWNGTAITGSCAPGCAPMSPRIVPISVFDVDEWQYRSESGDWNDAMGNNVCPIANTGCVRVVNILGFFVESQQSGDITGILLTHPGALVQGPPAPGGGAGFLQVIQLIR